MKRKKIMEMIFGILLVGSLVIYYVFCSRNSDGILKDEEIDKSERYAVDAGTTGSDNINPSYYEGIKVMTKEKFYVQQCRHIGETLYFAYGASQPVSVQMLNVSVKSSLNEMEQKQSEETIENCHTDIGNWNCFIFDASNQSRSISQDELEKVSKYIFIDLIIKNEGNSELIYSLDKLRMLLVHDNKIWDGSFYKNKDRKYISRGMVFSRPVLIDSSIDLQYAGLKTDTENGVTTYYRENNRDKADFPNAIYIDDSVTLRLMYICTDEEIETGRLALCSEQGNAWESGVFTNQGFVIDIGEEIKDAADHQSGDE